MKLLFTLSLFILISFVSRSQNFILNFEDTAVINQVYYTDTILDPQHIWQIGVPNKTLFDSAYSPPNAVVTLLDSALPPNTNASFIIKTEPIAYIGSGLAFEQKFDFDSLHSNGHIEFSIDSGRIWNNLTFLGNNNARDTTIGWTPQWQTVPSVTRDTLLNGNVYETGNSNGWVWGNVTFRCFVAKRNLSFPLWFKFTVITDSTNTGYHAGWLVDNINFTSGLGCFGAINEVNSSHIKVYPDPVIDGFTLSLTDAGIQDYSISIMDLTGRELLYREGQEPEVSLKRGCIAAGSYMIKVTDKQTGNIMEKRVVFE